MNMLEPDNRQRAIEEFARRWDGEMQKAVEKYGEVALVPAGHPEYDIFDYLINELVGLKRYGDMTEARAQLMHQTGTITKDEAAALYDIANDAVGASLDIGLRLIEIQQALRARGLTLGQPEKSYGNAATNETIRRIGGLGFTTGYTSRKGISAT
jgi:hypothetical protein